MRSVRDHLALRHRPPRAAGVVVAAVSVATCTAVIFALKLVAPVVSLGVVYLLGVVLVSAVWGLWLGVGTGFASAAAFNFFHISPTGRFTIAEGENWVALATFLVVALAASRLADAAFTRAQEADRRREEADLSADLARLLLGRELDEALPVVAQRIADALAIPAVELRLDMRAPLPERRMALPLHDGEERIGVLLVPDGMHRDVEDRLRERVVPALEATLRAALERQALVAEVVETSALRRSDSIKTAILRSVSHDLRTPLTTILAATDAVRAPDVSAAERDELGAMAYAEAERLARLIDQLLDLSRLQAGAVVPDIVPCSIEEILRAAADRRDGEVDVRVDRDVPPIAADPAHLERAFANVIDNAVRHGKGHPVQARARMVSGSLVVRIIDRGPGLPAAERDRVFAPFYRSGAAQDGPGSGLGLAIAKGFIEANDGTIAIESVPGQGTSVVVQLQLAPA